MDKFSKGEIVQLKSGGPKMTVESVEEKYNRVRCQWFAGSKLNDGHFSVDSLIKISMEEKNNIKDK